MGQFWWTAVIQIVELHGAFEHFRLYIFTSVNITSKLGQAASGAPFHLMEALKVSYPLHHPSKREGLTCNFAIVNHRADLKNAGEKRNELYARLEAQYMNLQNPVRTANKFGIEEIIDPADTRSLICAWTKHM